MSGELRMASQAPHPAAAAYVRRYIAWEERSAAPVVRRESASVDIPLILSLGAPFAVRPVAGGGGGAHRVGSFVAGVHDHPVDTEHPGVARGVQVDLSPLGARMLLGIPMSELARRTVDLEDLLGRQARLLVERLADAPAGSARLAIVDRFMVRRLDRARPPAPDIEWAWRRLRASGGRIGAGALAAELGCSGRHLAARFRDGVGVGPKLAGRILRFEAAQEALRRVPESGLGAVAARCGYYDQAHLHRDVRAFAGATPAELRQQVTSVQDAGA
jgi:AraC-like DNA-binding protein